jgi:hypothetical protein
MSFIDDADGFAKIVNNETIKGSIYPARINGIAK